MLVAQTITDESVLQLYESLAAILLDAGFSARSIVLAVSMLDSLSLGSALDLGAPSVIWQRSVEHSSFCRTPSIAPVWVTTGPSRLLRCNSR